MEHRREILTGPDRRNRIFFLAAAMIFLGYLYFYTPEVNILPECSFNRLTGLPCPTCGMTRSMNSFIHLNVAGSFSQHLMGPVLVLVLLSGSAVFSFELITGRNYTLRLFKNQGLLFWVALLFLWIASWLAGLFTS